MNYESEPITKIDFSSREESQEDKAALGSEIMDMAKWTETELSDEELRISLEGTPSLRPDLSDEEKAERKIPEWLSSRFLWLKSNADKAQDQEEISKIGSQALVIKAAEYLYAAPWASRQCLSLAHRVWDGKLQWDDVEIPDADAIMMQEQTARSIEERKESEEIGKAKKRKVA